MIAECFSRISEGSRGSQEVPEGSRGSLKVLEGSRGSQKVLNLIIIS